MFSVREIEVLARRLQLGLESRDLLRVDVDDPQQRSSPSAHGVGLADEHLDDPTRDGCLHVLRSIERRERRDSAGARDVLLPRHEERRSSGREHEHD